MSTTSQEKQFVQLTKEDCEYLLNLIEDMDSDTPYTEKQRAYTVPKLRQIAKDPRSKRLFYQDTDYLLELIEDDDLEEYAQQRMMTQATLEQIQELQNSAFQEQKSIERQRELRRSKRAGSQLLTQHFEERRTK